MKRKGKVIISLELLKELLKLEDSENITHVIRSEEDVLRDTLTIIISSNDTSTHTEMVAEGCLPPIKKL